MRIRLHPRRVAAALFSVLLIWLLASYLILPHWWEHQERHHPALGSPQQLTSTEAGIPGDPVNLFIVGSGEALRTALLRQGWFSADPVTVRSGLKIAEDAALGKPYSQAPVSPLFLFGRRQDLAFEKPVGNNPRERHHVRFWLAAAKDAQGRPAWWGAATFDRSVGLSHTTGEVTHHIAPGVDAERDLILSDLQTAGFAGISHRDGFQKISGKNGGGDFWQSDGKLGIATQPDPADGN